MTYITHSVCVQQHDTNSRCVGVCDTVCTHVSGRQVLSCACFSKWQSTSMFSRTVYHGNRDTSYPWLTWHTRSSSFGLTLATKHQEVWINLGFRKRFVKWRRIIHHHPFNTHEFKWNYLLMILHRSTRSENYFKEMHFFFFFLKYGLAACQISHFILFIVRSMSNISKQRIKHITWTPLPILMFSFNFFSMTIKYKKPGM